MQDSEALGVLARVGQADDYRNGGNSYAIGFTANYTNCHLVDGDEFTITKASSTSPFKLKYNAIASQPTDPAAAKACSDFWNSVNLSYSYRYGNLTGFGQDQFDGGGTRYVSITLDRSHEDPYVVHIYVSERGGAPQPDDGSATGTGNR